MNPLPEIEYDEWFNKPHPHDTMPIATNDPIEEYDPPCSVETQEEETPHEKAYKIATSKYNPFAVGGSENIHDFD